MTDEQGVTESAYRDLLDRAGLINDTAGTAGWAMLVDRANHDRAARQAKIVSGGCKTWEEYLEDVAWLRGAEFVIRVPEAVNNEVVEYKRQLDDQAPA